MLLRKLTLVVLHLDISYGGLKPFCATEHSKSESGIRFLAYFLPLVASPKGVFFPRFYSLHVRPPFPNPLYWCFVPKYADDVKINRSIENEEEISVLQSAIDIVQGWSREHGLSLAPQKSKAFNLSCGSFAPSYETGYIELASVTEIHVLIFLFTDKLSLFPHLKRNVNNSLSLIFTICSKP